MQERTQEVYKHRQANHSEIQIEENESAHAAFYGKELEAALPSFG